MIYSYRWWVSNRGRM